MNFHFIILAFLFQFSNCERILIVFPTLSISHVIPLQSLAKLLAEKDHNITFVSAFPLNKKIPNYRDVPIPYNEEDKRFVSEVSKDTKGANLFKILSGMPKMIYNTGNITLQMPAMRKLMKEEEFDLLIVGYFMTEFVLGLGDHFKCPTIVFSPAGVVSTLNGIVGNPLAPSSTPHFMVGHVDLRNFLTRVRNFMMNSLDLLVIKQVFKFYGKRVYDYNFPSDQYRSYEESLQNVSLILLNTHFSSSLPRPYLPNMIEVGGLQVKSTPSPLPEDLKKFLDGAEHGAILFSLGSNAKSTFLPKETVKMLLGAFKQVKQRVLMKWESDELEGKPDNVFISKWLPQDDVLAHKNMKAFISHCGYGGVIEAKFHGVPIIGIPFFGDQPTNAGMIVNEGWGIKIDLSTTTEESLKNVIEEIIGNPRYSNNVKRLSKLSKDRPQSPQETAVYWVEYVLRHHGAPHLHYPGADLNFLQDNSFDVIAFLAVVAYILIKIVAFVCKMICCCGGKAKGKEKTH